MSFLKDYEKAKASGSSGSSGGKTTSQKRIDSELQKKYPGYTGIKNVLKTFSQDVDESYIDSFINDMNSYTMDVDWENIGWGSAQQAYRDYADRIADLRSRGGRILAYLDQNVADFNLDSYHMLKDQIISAQNTLGEQMNALNQANHYYSQWDTEDAYNKAMQQSSWAKKYQGKGYQELVPLLEDLEDGEEKQWLTDYASAVDYDERINMDLDAANQEIQALQDQLNKARILEQRYNGFLDNSLLMLTQGDAWRALESAYDSFNEKYGSIEQLQETIEKKRLRMAEGKQTQDSIRAEAELEEWKKTVRDADTIQKELDKLNEVIALNEKSMRRLNQGSSQQDMQQRAELERELQYSRMRDYMALMDRPDFAKNSQYIPTGNGVPTMDKGQDGSVILDPASGMYVNSGFQDIEYDYINKNERAKAYQNAANNASNLKTAGLDRGWLLQLTEEETGIYNYLYRTEGKDAAWEFLDVMRGELNRRQRVAEETKWAEYAKAHPYIASAASIGLAPLKAVSAAGQVIDRIGDGKIDQNASYNRAAYISSAIRDQVTHEIQKNEKWGALGAFGYQTAMSMGDFLINGVAGGAFWGVPGVATAIMGSGAAADTVIQAKDRGLDDNAAFGLGIVAGLAEALTERVSLEALLDPDILKNGIGVYVLKNSLTEGSEEVASSVINLAADIIASKEKSEWQQAIRSYQNMGYSEEEAFAKAMADQAASLGMDFLGGALSGGIMSGANSAQYYADTKRTGRAMGRRGLTDTQQVQQILDAGANAEKGSAANAVAAQLQKKVDAGQKLSQYEKGRLYQSNPEAVGEAVFGQGSVSLASPFTQGISNQDERWQQAQRLSSITGRDIKFYNGAENENGYYDKKTGEIYVNTNAADTVAQVVSHELTHSTELAESYADLARYVRGKIRAEGRDWNQLRQEKADFYAAQGHPLEDDSDVEAEIVAEYVQKHLLTNEQEIYEAVWESPTLGQKILNWIDGILAKLNNQKAKERQMLNNAREIYARALEESSKAGEKKNTRPVPQKIAGQAQRSTAREIAPPQNEGDMRRYMEELYDSGQLTEEEFDEYLASLEHDAAAEEGMEELGRQYSLAMLDAEYADKQNYIDSDVSSEEAEAGIQEVATMAPVAQITGNEFAKGEVDLITQVERFFAQENNEVYNPQIGTVILDRKGVKSDIAHGIGRKKAAAFAAVPDVIEKGRVVDYQKNWKQRGYDTAVIAAPIQIGEEEHIAAIIAIRSRNTNLFYLHEVMTTKNGAMPFKTGARKSGLPSGDAPSIFSILDRIVEVKNNTDHSSTEKQFSLSGTASAGALNKRDVARDLRAILSRGGDPRELQRYVDSLERSRHETERTGENRYQTGENRNSTAQEILEAAHSQGQSVEEYLRWNPEQFEVDGRWRSEALEAIRMEQGGRQYSLATSNRKQTMPMDQAEQKAISIFGVTTDFGETGFILTTGRMLKFTDEEHPGERIYDHRAIGKVYGVDVDLNDNHGFNYESNGFMDEFVENGGIRFDPGEPEFNMDAGMQLSRSVPITREQEQTIRDFIEWKKQREENYSAENDPLSLYSGPLALHVDFGGNSEIAVSSGAKDLDAWGIKHLTYEGGQINSSRIISDIRHYYRTGETRKPSAVAQFRYSLNTEEETVESQARVIQRENLPTKAQNYLARAESTLLNRIGEALSVPRYARYNSLKEIIQEISNTYLADGTISDEKMSELFDKAYAAGIVTDAEFYNQYKEIKDHLRTYGVTISDRDKSDIPDFDDFRKRAFGTLRILKEGGVPVDTAYDELRNMAPELFPDSVTHPADQLVRMFEVGQSIAVSQKNLDEYYGHSEAERDEFRKWAKNDFDAAVGDAFRDLRQVRRYAEEQSTQEDVKKILTVEEAEEAFQELKKLRRNVDKVRAKNLLTESDEILLDRMMKGEIGPQHLNPNEDNVKGITALYEAKMAYESQVEVLAAYKRSVKAKRLQDADRYLETATGWKDKKAGILYARETMRRNIMDIVPDKKLAERIAEHYFEAVHIQEAKSTKFKNDYRERVRALNLSTKVIKGNLVSEAHAVQLLGEAMDNIRVMENARGRMGMRDGKTLAEWRAVVDDLWMNNTGLDRQKVERAVEEFRKIYDELFQQMNRIRVENGYEPVNYRQGYFPHFQPGGDGIMGFFGKVMGINTQVDALPTTINGLTHTFKPGIQWFGNAQERIGFNTAYDAVEGFDRYIEGVSSVIFQTENIQKLRALATQARYRTSDEGIRKQVDAVRMDDRLTEEEKQREINAIYEHGKFALSNFVAELDEYTNLLANKKSKYDRTIESLIGRRAYTMMKAWENRVGANMIAGNISSALTNFIPLTQAGAQLDSGMMLKGMLDTLRNMKQGDNLVGMSDFLTNRRGSDPLVRTWMQKASNIMGTPMELIDNFTSESIVRAAYLQNLKRGMSEAEAMHQADIFAAGVMADRSKGAMPTLFESRNPLFKAFTQFQLEVNNQFSEVFKDLPRNHREKGLAMLALILLKYFLGAWMYNELFEKVIGRRSALDPFGILLEATEDLTGYEIPNIFDMVIKGERIEKTGEGSIGEAGANLAINVLGELPFSAGLNLFGFETDGGRLPAASAIPDFSAVWEAATGWDSETGEDLKANQRWKLLQDELNKLAYVLPPFGGGQISKSYKGIKAYLEGGSYSLDKDGDEILQYPVYKDDPDDAFWSLVRAAFLGKNSLPEAQDWVKSGYDSLNQYETVVYQDLLNCGVKDRDAFTLVDQLRKLEETETEAGARRAQGRRILAKSDISAEGKAAAFYGMVATKTEREWMDELVDAGADQADTMAFVSNLYDAKSMKGMEKKQEQLSVFLDAPLTEEEKKVAIGFIMDTDLETESGNPTQYAKFLSALETGLTVDKYMEIRATETDIEDYLELTDVGIKGDKAADLSISMATLEPVEGYDNVSWIQRCRTVMDANLSETEKLRALQTVDGMYESTYEKIVTGHNMGMNVKSYIDLKSIMPKFDENGNGTYTQSETEAAINALAGDDNALYALTGTTPNGYTLTDREKAILWQLQNKSWKPYRNPFNREVGQMVYDIMHEETAQNDTETAESGAVFDIANLFSKVK